MSRDHGEVAETAPLFSAVQETILNNSKLFFVVRVSCQVILVSANKLTRYIEPCQLTDDFGGSLDYDHSDWLNKRLVTTSFILD